MRLPLSKVTTGVMMMSRTSRNNHSAYKRPLSFGIIRNLQRAFDFMTCEGFAPRSRDLTIRDKYTNNRDGFNTLPKIKVNLYD
jgi:hypothetical protein